MRGMHTRALDVREGEDAFDTARARRECGRRLICVHRTFDGDVCTGVEVTYHGEDVRERGGIPPPPSTSTEYTEKLCFCLVGYV